MRKGFTLIELLVASILLSMIATILTMVFNQSSIIWRTGVAGVENLKQTRSALGAFHDICDELLPGLGDNTTSAGGSSDNRTVRYRTVSLWEGGKLRSGGTKRAFGAFGQEVKWGKATEFNIDMARKATAMNPLNGNDDGNGNEKVGFSVGVRSYGPDGEPDTPDDITTWPEEID